jgi:hypothetical protein
MAMNPEPPIRCMASLGRQFLGPSCTEMMEVEPLILATATGAGADVRPTI